MEASAQLWRPLGAILMARGLLTADQLDHALRVQHETGGRLGTVLVDLELVPRELLITVLLEQCGLESEMQNGFGSGLLVELRRRGSAHRRVAPELSVVRPVPPEPEVAPTTAPSEAPSGGLRRWRRRRPDEASRERAERLAAAFKAVEDWTSQLQRDVAELRRLIADAAS
jgi:hypothetical protein